MLTKYPKFVRNAL